MLDSSSSQPPEGRSSNVYSEPLIRPEPIGTPARDSDSRVLRAVLVTAAIFIGLGFIAVGAVGFGVWYLAKSFHAVPSATFTENDLGIAIYPGAEPSLRGSRAELAGKTMVNATYITADSADKVIAFYKEKAGPSAHLTTTSRGSEFRVTGAAGEFTTVKVMRVPDGSGGETYIAIMRVTRVVPH